LSKENKTQHETAQEDPADAKGLKKQGMEVSNLKPYSSHTASVLETLNY